MSLDSSISTHEEEVFSLPSSLELHLISEARLNDIVHYLNLLSSFKKIRWNMFLKQHFLHSHLEIFPEIIEPISVEPEKRIHNDIADMEKEIQREMQ